MNRQHTPNQPTPLLTVEDLATYLCVSTKTVRRMVDAREITHIRVGRAIRFRQEDVDEYLNREIVEAQPLGEVA